MPYLIININYPFYLKKINCLELYNLNIKLAIILTKLENFIRNIKYNLIIFIYYDLSLKNLKKIK